MACLCDGFALWTAEQLHPRDPRHARKSCFSHGIVPGLGHSSTGSVHMPETNAVPVDFTSHVPSTARNHWPQNR